MLCLVMKKKNTYDGSSFQGVGVGKKKLLSAAECSERVKSKQDMSVTSQSGACYIFQR